MSGRDTLLVVVGAGASHDCVPQQGVPQVRPPDGSPVGLELPLPHVRPPLTRDLVNPQALQNILADRYRLAQPLIDHLRWVSRNDAESPTPLEVALAAYQSGADQNPMVTRHILAIRFYLRDLLLACTDYMRSIDLSGGITNYTGLVNTLHQWACEKDRHLCVVSFNYDLLIDRACEEAWGLDVANLATYIGDDGRASLLKPHGSALWGWHVNAPATQSWNKYTTVDQIFAEGNQSIDESNIFAFPHLVKNQKGQTKATQPPVVPALVLPLHGKSEFVWPEDQAQHFTQDLVQSVDRMIIVGWRAAENHFIEQLEKVLRPNYKLLLVTKGDDAERNDILSAFPSATEVAGPVTRRRSKSKGSRV